MTTFSTLSVKEASEHAARAAQGGTTPSMTSGQADALMALVLNGTHTDGNYLDVRIDSATNHISTGYLYMALAHASTNLEHVTHPIQLAMPFCGNKQRISSIPLEISLPSLVRNFLCTI